MLRRNPRGRKAADPASSAQPQSLIGAFLLAMLYSDPAERARVEPRFAARFPYGAADQEIVGDIVFGGLVREMFASYPSASEMVDEFGTSLVAIMEPDTTVQPADMVAAIRAALKGGPPPAGVDPADLMNIHIGFAVAAVHQLELPRAEVARLFEDAERQAVEQGVWLVPRAEEEKPEAAPPGTTAAAQPSAAAASGPWDVADLADPREGRIDFGSLLLRPPQRSDVRLLTSGDEIVAVEVRLSRTVLQLQAFAAGPDGAWDAVRAEVAEQVVRRSGTAREIAGIGIELWTQSVHTESTEEPRIKHMRFLGKDGPGWFFRAVFQWRATPAQEEFDVLEQVFRDTVVIRGTAEVADRARLRLVAP